MRRPQSRHQVYRANADKNPHPHNLPPPQLAMLAPLMQKEKAQCPEEEEIQATLQFARKIRPGTTEEIVVA